MTGTATSTMTIFCRAKEATDTYQADVVPDLTITELVAGLNEVSYLPALSAGERWRVVHMRTNSDLPPNARLDEHEVKDGDQLEFLRDSHGAGS